MSTQPTEQELEQQFQERHANIMNTLGQAQEKLVSGVEGIKNSVQSTLNPPEDSLQQQKQEAQDALRDASRVSTAQDETAVRSGTALQFARVGRHVEDTFASDTLTGEEAMEK